MTDRQHNNGVDRPLGAGAVESPPGLTGSEPTPNGPPYNTQAGFNHSSPSEREGWVNFSSLSHAEHGIILHSFI